MNTTRTIIDLYKSEPNLTTQQAAERIGCSAAYIRAVCGRKGMRFKHSPQGRLKNRLTESSKHVQCEDGCRTWPCAECGKGF